MQPAQNRPNVDNAEHRTVAEPNTVLLGLVGSTVHGVTVDDADDRDEMGICIEPPEYVAGLRHFAYAAGWKKFEPLWDFVIRARQAGSMLPVLETILSEFGRRGSSGAIGPRESMAACMRPERKREMSQSRSSSPTAPAISR